MAGDDDKDHARGHDRHADGLDRQIEDVARRQKTPIGQHIEDQTDDHEGADHAQKTGIKLKRLKGVLALCSG